MNTLQSNFYVFCALIRRNMRVFSAELVNTIIDGFVLVVSDVILFGYFLPLMGMSRELIAPLYIGTLIFILFFLGENLAIRHVFDLKYDRFIDYHITLPISKSWLFAHYIISFMIEALILSIPLLIAGFVLLPTTNLSIDLPRIMAALALYLLVLLFFGIFFLYMSLSSSYEWFMDNLWPRVLSPLYSFGCTVFTWHQVYSISKPLALVCLLNPMTYISEGLRSLLIGGEFIPAWICTLVVILSIFGCAFLLKNSVKTQLDPI